jgi:protein-L-isoaspartate O-methyltransferase
MARLPKDAPEAVQMLGVTAGQTVIAVGPDHGYASAFVDAVGGDGSVVVASPPPDEDAPAGAEVVDAVADDAQADHVFGWIGIISVPESRKLTSHVKDGGALWLVLPRAERDKQAAVTEGDVKRAMLSAGWKEERVVPLTTDSFAVRFRRRR